MRSRTMFGIAGLTAMIVCATGLNAQQPAQPIRLAGVGFGVDTTAVDVGDIVRLCRAYLAGPATAGDSAARAAGLWQDMDDVDGWPTGDLTRGLGAYQGFPATVVGVNSAAQGDSVYILKLLYASADSAGVVRPLALQRLYAVRSPGAPYGWKLSGAFARITRRWERLTAGRIHFRYAPGLHPDSARAQRSAAFVDSIATLFQVPPPPAIGYLVASSEDEYYRATGIDFFPLESGRGSATAGKAGGGVVYAGDPRQGEGYLHELTHVVLQRACCGTVTLGEGIPVWLGGSKGLSTRQLYEHLVAYQKAHPNLTLEKVIDPEFEGLYHIDGYEAVQATNALLVESVFRRKGIAGVRDLMPFNAGPGALLSLLGKDIHEMARDPNGWWRRTAEQLAGGR